MNWDAIGAVGEIIGALAVIATLFYLASQIRQNTNSNEAELFRNAQAAFSTWRQMTITHADLLARHFADETLTPAERIILNNMAIEFCFVCASNHQISSAYQWGDKERFVRLMATQIKGDASIREFWPNCVIAMRASGFEDFVDLVETRRG